MYHEITIPSGSLLPAGTTIKIDLGMKGKHHKMLVASNPKYFDRSLVSVIDDLMEGSASNLSLADIYYLFFQLRANSISPEYEFSWSCGATRRKRGVMAKCGYHNDSVFDIGRDLNVTSIPHDFEYPKYKVEYMGKDSEVYVRMLSIKEEFQIEDELDSFPGYVDKDDKEQALDRAFYRLYYATKFTNDALDSMPIEDKIKFFDEMPYRIQNELMQDLHYLSGVGVDMTQPLRLKCAKCGEVSDVRLPFSAEFLLPTRG